LVRLSSSDSFEVKLAPMDWENISFGRRQKRPLRATLEMSRDVLTAGEDNGAEREERFVSRPLRVEFPGAVYHITARGAADEAIFLTNEDRERFLQILVDIIAQCLER
jgi:hypothetical protein